MYPVNPVEKLVVPPVIEVEPPVKLRVGRNPDVCPKVVVVCPKVVEPKLDVPPAENGRN